MIYIRHRQNTSRDLELLAPQYGIEVDLRCDIQESGKIITAHDAFSTEDDFSLWIDTYAQKKITGPLILNTKADLLEDSLIKILREYKIENFLFLDTATPTFIKYMHSDLARHFMGRLSKYESLEFALQFKNKMQWLWVDCFAAAPLALSMVAEAAKHFKLCLVSPELQGGNLSAKLQSFLPLTPHCSSICTKHIDLWKAAIG